MKKIDKKIESQIDSFITTTLADYKEYQLSGYMLSHLTYFIYVLLNKDFQSFIIHCREILDIPTTGFSSQEDYDSWRKEFNTTILKHRNGTLRDSKRMKLISYMQTKVEDIYSRKDAHHTFLVVLLRSIEVDDLFFSVWFLFLANTLFIFRPDVFLRNLKVLGKRKWKQAIHIKKNELTIYLNAKTTINSLKATLDKNKDGINKHIEILKHKVSENALEVKELERDYLIYKSYISHHSTKKRGENIYDNVTKEMHVVEELESDPAIENLDFGSIRKIVSRMNKRIENTYLDKIPTFTNVLNSIENSPLHTRRT